MIIRSRSRKIFLVVTKSRSTVVEVMVKYETYLQTEQ